MRNTFDSEKALEAILYVAKATDGDMYKILKLLYLADKLHLEKYGSLITGDSYFALQYGPTPSDTYDMVKAAKGDVRMPLKGVVPRDAITVDGNTIVPNRNADETVLSKSDLSCLDESVRQYGNLSFGQIKNLVHDKAYHATEENGRIGLDTIASTLPNAADVIQFLSDPYPEQEHHKEK